jgi:hypothetical protein
MGHPQSVPVAPRAPDSNVATDGLPLVTLDGALATSLSRSEIRSLQTNLENLQAIAKRLEDNQHMFEANAQVERLAAHKLAKQNQPIPARQALVRSKQLLAQSERVAANLTMVYNQIMLLSNAQLNHDLMAVLQASNGALKTVCQSKNISPEQVADITAELKTHTQQIETINDAMTNATKIAAPELDNAELDRELQALAAEPLPQEPLPPLDAVDTEPTQRRLVTHEEDNTDDDMASLADALTAASVVTKAAARALPRQQSAPVVAKQPRAKQRQSAAPRTAVAVASSSASSAPRSVLFVNASEH